jgi:hypothetical protein
MCKQNSLHSHFVSFNETLRAVTKTLPCASAYIDFTPPMRIIMKVKEKVNSSLCLTKHHIMKTYSGSGSNSAMHSLTSALDGGECQLHAPAALSPGKEALVPIE